MKKNAIPLGRILGIPIGLDYSWFLVFGLFTWMLATSYYPVQFKEWPTLQYWLVGAITTILLFVSVLLHELGHAAVSQRYNISVRSITLFIFGGVAQIESEPPSAVAEFWIAIAGPIVNFVLALIFWLLLPLTTAATPLFALLQYLAIINVSLAIFNLIPGFPLDGGRVFRAIVWGLGKDMQRATLIAANVGRGFAYLFIFIGLWQIFKGDFGNGLWTVFIGWFLESAAVAQVQQQLVHNLLAGRRVGQAMSRRYVAIPPEMTLQQLVDRHILDGGQRSFVIEQGNELLGLLTLHHLKKVPAEQWPNTAVTQAMLPAGQLKTTSPDTKLWAALEEMDKDGVSQLPVMESGRLVGMLSREDVISFLRTLQTLRA